MVAVLLGDIMLGKGYVGVGVAEFHSLPKYADDLGLDIADSLVLVEVDIEHAHAVGAERVDKIARLTVGIVYVRMDTLVYKMDPVCKSVDAARALGQRGSLDGILPCELLDIGGDMIDLFFDGNKLFAQLFSGKHYKRYAEDDRKGCAYNNRYSVRQKLSVVPVGVKIYGDYARNLTF